MYPADTMPKVNTNVIAFFMVNIISNSNNIVNMFMGIVLDGQAEGLIFDHL